MDEPGHGADLGGHRPPLQRFRVKSELRGYEPRKASGALAELERELLDRWHARPMREPARDDRFFLEPAARKAIFDHIGWVGPQAENAVEQGGLLLGEVLETGDGGFLGVAKRAVPAHRGQGSSAYLRLDHAAWKAMFDEVDALPHDEHSQIIGWYHTHPCSLDVFMSGTDRNTQRTMFSSPWHFAIVLNPHRKFWRAFHGAEAHECPGYLLRAEHEPRGEPQGAAPLAAGTPPPESEELEPPPVKPAEKSYARVLGLLGFLILLLAVGVAELRKRMAAAEKRWNSQIASLRRDVSAGRTEQAAGRAQLRNLEGQLLEQKSAQAKLEKHHAEAEARAEAFQNEFQALQPQAAKAPPPQPRRPLNALGDLVVASARAAAGQAAATKAE